MHGYEFYVAYSDIFSVIPSQQFPRCHLVSIIWPVICLLTALLGGCRFVWMVVCVFIYAILGNACPTAAEDIACKRTKVKPNGRHFEDIFKDCVGNNWMSIHVGMECVPWVKLAILRSLWSDSWVRGGTTVIGFDVCISMPSCHYQQVITNKQMLSWKIPEIVP